MKVLITIQVIYIFVFKPLKGAFEKKCQNWARLGFEQLNSCSWIKLCSWYFVGGDLQVVIMSFPTSGCSIHEVGKRKKKTWTPPRRHVICLLCQSMKSLLKYFYSYRLVVLFYYSERHATFWTEIAEQHQQQTIGLA